MDYPQLHFPDGLTLDDFIADYWQRKPLLMRQALPGFRSPLSADELAGLACEPDVESRIIQEHGPTQPWQTWHGPFEEVAFSHLPENDWTLLVQDVDKHEPDVAALLERFRFIPEWRLDDIMISYAEDGGSVGPHQDQYDVFLIQAEGRRRWRIDESPTPDPALIADLDLRILRHFSPTQDWILEPGDILYLPPGVPHWGVADGPCTTWSLGLRAPAWRELAGSWFDNLVDRFAPEGHCVSAPLASHDDPARMPKALFEQVRTRIEQLLLNADDSDFRSWLGALLSEQKDNLFLEPLEPPLADSALKQILEDNPILHRASASKLFYASSGGPQRDDLLFANGQTHALPPCCGDFLPVLCARPGPNAAALRLWLKDHPCRALLLRLINDGHFSIRT